MTQAEKLALIAVGLLVVSDLFEFLALYTEFTGETEREVKREVRKTYHNNLV